MFQAHIFNSHTDDHKHLLKLKSWTIAPIFKIRFLKLELLTHILSLNAKACPLHLYYVYIVQLTNISIEKNHTT